MKKSGFTLIELMIVIVILGFLIVAGLGSFTSSQKKGRDSKRKNDVRQMGLALETYYNDFGHYPLADGSGTMLGCGSGATSACVAGSMWSNTGVNPVTIYMQQLPVDPSPGSAYYYAADAGGTYYKIYARLENTLDTGKGVNQSGYAGTNCGGGNTCTYGVSSSNSTP